MSQQDNSNQNKAGEVNYKKDFCLKYFDEGTWSLDVLEKVDVLLTDRQGRYMLYIESKNFITGVEARREAIAQVILTNKKQEAVLSRVALIYQDGNGNDVLELIDCSDDSVMYNNDINWKAEKASSPSKDAVNRINDRVIGRITKFRGEEEIRAAYSSLKRGQKAVINITERNVQTVYNHWKNEIRFHEYLPNEQDKINLFLVDLLNGTVYKWSVFRDVDENTLFGIMRNQMKEKEPEEDLKNEGTNLNNYRIMYIKDVVDGIKYKGYPNSYYYHIENASQYDAFWRKYKRPPEKREFLKILEHSSQLYSEKYRRDTGGEYTPSCFVRKQNEILRQHYNLDEFIVCDPCAGVGNLENEFGKDYKQFCYLSTLVQTDVDTCCIKGFENVVLFDYMKNDEQPQWKYRGIMLDIREIARREGRKLMVVMNPPYTRQKGFDNDFAIEFFNKVVKLQPDVIVYYCKTEFFLRQATMKFFVNSGYNIVSHLFSNAKSTFKLSEWAISQVIFDKEKGEKIIPDKVKADRYEYDRRTHLLNYIRTYTYDMSRPKLIKEIENEIKEHAKGFTLGQWTNDHYCLVLSNRRTHAQRITTQNLYYSLLLKGLNFNTHAKYFETSDLTYRGTFEEIEDELKLDAIMFALFYKGCNFSNKEGQRNYIMPFTAEELGCGVNELYVFFPDDNPENNEMSILPFDDSIPQELRFDFREFLNQFNFSDEARSLYNAALEVFRYYHHSHEYPNTDWNDSYYDIANAIMRRNPADYQQMNVEDDRRITRVKTTKGTLGFSRKSILNVIPKEHVQIFTRFFDARDALAMKINRQLVEQKLLLWERENIF